ncbi:MAG: aldose 1-epimerase family protein [Clostridia bacterium]|nr:aldose 1-epimerase family protein [Clostridia bacterium]
MIYTLKNDRLTVEISDLGGEVQSVKKDGCEYIWQGDSTYWTSRAPLLFPICGRFFEAKYTYDGKTYEMGTHGFLRHSLMKLEKHTDTELGFSLTANEKTKEQYPFDFALTLTYTLTKNRLTTAISVKNTGKKVLPFAFGGHPGFMVPLDRGDFSDWYLEFSEDCSPDELVFSDTCFATGKKRPYPLVDSRKLPLSHHLFDIDGVFLSRTSGKATLKSDLSGRSVTLVYPEFPYLGLWHKPRSDAPYVCIEPWCGLPSPDGKIEALEDKTDVFRLAPKKEKSLAFSIEFT